MTAPTSPDPPRPSHVQLFAAFFRITVSGFGGALPWTRRMFVERKKWLTAEEFNDAYALCQLLPGPNIVNLAAVFGSRAQGASGAFSAWAGFLLLPFTAMVGAAIFYRHYGDVEAVRGVLSGVAPAAAGLLVATAAKMAGPVFRRGGPAPLIVIAVSIAIGVLNWPLVYVLLVLTPLSVALSAWRNKP
ncbi:MAG: chromate transporter [Mycobacterium sp.]|nr:chromate transporter [Mycobacterium sp.]